ncbi:MAG: DUF2723 domain-containing protein [Ignavibacteriaceae bacterium]|jgi:hypothetical protein|nr:DUF2723 domain-containing protein [Ignavibacteriaceae bacterium]MBP9123065.1 DUF2723 domain-containing protein [Ignavibacteriaceae bacterium]
MDIIKKYYAAITSLFVFIIYFSTMAPSVLQIDTGELAAAQALPGIAHPTGYPLFTMLGWLFSLIPLPVSTIFQLNLFAAITTTVGVYFFIKSIYYILNNFSVFEKSVRGSKSKKAKSGKKQVETGKAKSHSAASEVFSVNADSQSLPMVFSIVGGLVLAFGKTVWFQSTSVEVYSLHLALISAALFTLLRAFGGEVTKSQSHEVNSPDVVTNKVTPKSQIFDWLVFAGVLALAFSNHMTTLLIIPATAYLFFVKFKFQKEGFITLAKMLLLFFPILILIYLYLPIRAGMNPEINWGNPIDLERILRHVSGKQYQVWLFSSSEAAAKNFGRFFSGLPSEFYLSLVAVLLGIFYLIQRSTKLLITSLLLIFGTVLYAINYDIVDLESYFLLAYIGMSILVVFGLMFVYERVNNLKITAAVGAVLVLSQIGFTYGSVNQSGNLIFEQYTKAILKTAPKNSVIFSYQWDYFLSASYYFQFVENERRDVAIIDKELLRRSWYYQQLDNCYPWLTGSYKKEADVFKREVVPFEKDLPYAAQVIEGAYKDVMLAILLKNYKDRPVFIAPELVDKELANKEFELPANMKLIPDLFFYRLTDNDDYIPAADPDFIYQSGGVNNIYIEQINALTGAMLLRRAQYELSYNKKERAKLYIDKVLKDFPGTTVPQEFLEKIK